MVEAIFWLTGRLSNLSGFGRMVAWLIMVVIVAGLLAGSATLLRKYGSVLRPTLAALFLFVAGSGALLLTDQGAEIAESLVDDGWWMPMLFLLSVSFWAWQSWFWSRAALNLSLGTKRSDWTQPALTTWLPRAYGLAIYTVAGIMILRAAISAGDQSASFYIILAGLAALTAFFLFAALLREPLWQKVDAGFLHRDRRIGRLIHSLERFPAPRSWQDIARTYPLANLNIILTVLLLVGLVFWAGWYPVEVGHLFGSAALAFLALGTWVSVLTALQLMQTGYSVSIVAVLVTISIVGSWIRHYHQVRVVEGQYKSVPLRFADAAQRWADHAGVHKGGSGVPVIFVAAAGGGLRAAYWTADVLTALNRDYPRFYDHLFAVSSVSGGSLGAVVAQAVVGAQRRGQLGAEQARQTALDALAQDYLAPVIAAGVYTDVVASVLPDVFGFGGRGTALENAWSAGLPVAGSYPLDRPFLDLWEPVAERGWLPALLLNATHEESGKRVITSNLQIDNWPFADAKDLRSALGYDMRASTAVHNSARFSWVSPAGTILDGSKIQHGHVLDGGYFENYGALTLLETIEGLRKILDGLPLKPIIIQISSDPELKLEDIAGTQDRECPPSHPKPLLWQPGGVSLWSIANEALAPIGGLFQTREARGINASKLVARWGACVASDDRDMARGPADMPEYVHLRMCDSEHPAPLGWLMAAHTRTDIDNLLDPLGCNANELGRLRHALASLGEQQLVAR